jgi:dienelactone hydrolase
MLKLIATMAFGLCTSIAVAQESGRPPRYVEKETFVPAGRALPGLDVVEIYVDTPGRHPLAILTHGTSVKPEERAHVTPWAQYHQALWFAQRGFVVLVVVRQGYGRSSGEQDSHEGGCGRGSFADAGDASAQDLRAVVRWAAKLPEVNAETVLSAGVSTGGFAQVALSADPPPGLKAAISFAGGRGSDGKEHNCNLDGLVHAFESFGKSASKHGDIPMLWIYSENDHYFPPPMAVKFDEAYRKGGGADQFVMAPPDGEDGHHLYAHVEAWSATVESFLKAHDLLPMGERVFAPPPVPDVPAPEGIHDKGLEGWKRYLAGAPYKAFASNGDGFWGSAMGAFDQGLADNDALERCKKAAAGKAGSCKVVARTGGR